MSLASLLGSPRLRRMVVLGVLCFSCSSPPASLFGASGGATSSAGGSDAGSGGASLSELGGGSGGVFTANGGRGDGGNVARGGAAASGGVLQGGGANAGSGGNADAQGGNAVGPCLALHVLDDAEDRNNAICRNDGHVGNWWTTNDGTSNNQQPQPNSTVIPQRVTDRPGSSYAMRTTGSGFTAWGATLGFDVRTAPNLPYDASRFNALRFFAKGPVDGTIRVSIRVSQTTPTSLGGTCVESGGGCYHYHGVEMPVSNDWQEYSVRFDDLKRENDWDGAFDSESVLAVEFRINNPACTKSFTLWVDDVAFVEP